MATAAELFREQRWAQLLALTQGSEDPADLTAQCWALLELGRVDEGCAVLREVLAQDSHVGTAWGPWELRQRFGGAKLIEWGLNDAVLSWSWSRLRLWPEETSWHQHVTPGWLNGWLNPSLWRLLVAVPRAARHQTPWQLGGALAPQDSHVDPLLREVVLHEVATWAGLSASERRTVEAWREGRPLSALVSGASLRVDRDSYRPTEIFRAVAHQRESVELMFVAGRAAATVASIEETRRLCAQVEACLLRADLAGWLPEAAAHRAEQLDTVIFRATPLRAVEAAVALMKDGRFGALVRRVLPGEGPSFEWHEGERDDVLAMMPDREFHDAVAAAFSRAAPGSHTAVARAPSV